MSTDLTSPVSSASSDGAAPSSGRAPWLLVDGSVEHALGVTAFPLVSWAAAAPRQRPTVVSLRNESGSEIWTHRPAADAREIRIGRALEPFQTYTVVASGIEGDRFATLETGPLTSVDWTAHWLSAPAGTSLRTTLRLPASTEKVRLFVAAQGLVRLSINGIPLNENRLDPSRSAPARALARAFDITGLVTEGPNDVEVVLGLGSWGATKQDPRVLVELDHWVAGVRHAQGLRDVTASGSAVVTQEPFYLERIDAGRRPVAPPRVVDLTADGDDSVPASVVPDASPVVRVVDTRRVAEIGRVDGARIYDVGENIAGRTRITLRSDLPPRCVVSMIHGEHIAPDGTVDTTNLTMPYDRGRERQVFEWVPAGRSGEQGEAWFSYYGFRYVEVRGLPEEAVVEVDARVLHSDVSSSLEVVTSDDHLAALFRVATRTTLNNLHSVPEDCPTREQAAWTGDVASAAEWEFAALDVRSFFAKWLVDLADSQQEDGAVAGIAPDPRGFTMGSDAVWGSALPRVAWNHWLHYGDAAVLEQALPPLRRWCAYIRSNIGDSGVVDGFPISYGHDWLALDQTPPVLLHTAAAIDTLDVLGRLEDAAGEDGSGSRRQAEYLRAAARRMFVSPEGTVANGSQGALATALAAGILNTDAARDAARELGANVAARGYRVSTGFAATRWAVEALARDGQHEMIAAMLRQADEPGIGAMLASGPGTFWESWWIDSENTGTGSLDHVGLGAPFAAWAVRDVAGLSPIAPGWSVARFAPHFLDGVERMQLTLRTVRGSITARWHRFGDRVDVSLDLPDGVEADVELPDGRGMRVTGGSHRWQIDAPVATPLAIPTSQAWRAPAIASRSADIDREPMHQGALRAGRGQPLITGIDLTCTPVTHAQHDRPVALVRSTSRGTPPSVVLPVPGEPNEHPDAPRFVYALLDLCMESPGVESAMLLRLRRRDGSTREALARVWPAGWNRVSIDLEPGEADNVVELEIGLVVVGEAGDDLAVYKADPDTPFAFHLGDVGFSGRMRSW